MMSKIQSAPDVVVMLGVIKGYCKLQFVVVDNLLR